MDSRTKALEEDLTKALDLLELLSYHHWLRPAQVDLGEPPERTFIVATDPHFCSQGRESAQVKTVDLLAKHQRVKIFVKQFGSRRFTDELPNTDKVRH